jgi:hypothetical protein
MILCSFYAFNISYNSIQLCNLPTNLYIIKMTAVFIQIPHILIWKVLKVNLYYLFQNFTWELLWRKHNTKKVRPDLTKLGHQPRTNTGIIHLNPLQQHSLHIVLTSWINISESLEHIYQVCTSSRHVSSHFIASHQQKQKDFLVCKLLIWFCLVYYALF